MIDTIGSSLSLCPVIVLRIEINAIDVDDVAADIIAIADISLIKTIEPTSPANNATIGNKFTVGEYVLTNRNTALRIDTEGEERYAVAYYEITRTNADNTVDRIQTNKELTQTEKDDLPSGFSQTPVAVTVWDHEVRENNKNREINLLELQYVEPFESDFISKMGG